MVFCSHTWWGLLSLLIRNITVGVLPCMPTRKGLGSPHSWLYWVILDLPVPVSTVQSKWKGMASNSLRAVPIVEILPLPLRKLSQELAHLLLSSIFLLWEIMSSTLPVPLGSSWWDSISTKRVCPEGSWNFCPWGSSKHNRTVSEQPELIQLHSRLSNKWGGFLGWRLCRSTYNSQAFLSSEFTYNH